MMPVTGTATMLVAVAVLAAGTLALRVAGPVLRARVGLSPRVEHIMTMASMVLLAALVATAALLDGRTFAGVARPAGVVVGGALAVRGAPFVVVVVAAATTTAVLRLLGVA
jgi:branched-subunit amino acid transport protein